MSSWPAGDGVGATSSTPALVTPLAMPGCSTRKLSRPACERCFVRSDWTRRGLGTRILEACEAAARAEGYRTLALMATLPGEPLYMHYGFREIERVEIALPDGCKLAGVSMTKPVESLGSLGGS